MPELYKNRSFVFEEGEEITGIYYLLDGSLELVHQFETENEQYELIFAHLANNTFFGVECFFESKFSLYKARCQSDSTINLVNIGNRAKLNELLIGKPDYGTLVLRSLLKVMAETANFILQLNKLFTSITKLETIGLAVAGHMQKEFKCNLPNEELAALLEENYNFFKDHKISLYPFTKDVFSAPFEKVMLEELSLINTLDKKEVNFFTRLYTLSSDLQNKLYLTEPFFVSYFSEKASLHFISLLKSISLFFEKVLEKYANLTGPHGIFHNLLNMKSQVAQNVDLTKYLTLVLNTLISNTEKISTLLQSNAPVYYKRLLENLGNFQALNKQEAKNAESRIEVEESYTLPEELKGSMTKIMDFAELDPEEYKAFLSDFNKFKLMDDKLSGDEAIKRFRRNITEAYWKVYEKAFIRYYQSTQLPKPVEMMLRFGYFDEQLINNKTIVKLYNYKPEPIDNDLPIYDTMEWLVQIASAQHDPSITGMGEEYHKHLKEEAKRLSRRTVVTPEDVDTTEYRVNFEIKNMMKDCARVCSGEIFNYSPILLKEAFNGDADKYFLAKKKLKEDFFKLRSIDFGTFYRETRFRDPERNIEEFIQQEVMPSIILLPTWGSRPMTWQVKERSKSSAGRLMFPHFILDNPYNILIEVFGIYRWEIIKEMLGPLWNDITKMSLTAEYTDYIQYYKKNKDLSLETKEKIYQTFKKFRTDRERFVNDYKFWIKFESEGRPMLNRVVRNIFYRHCP
ncbi:MAG: hypothetical protein CVV50_01060, partial [Spirochaetae bacterium HGW-Spirochaetae-6]